MKIALENYQYIAGLVNRFNDGTLTESQQDELDLWVTASDQHQRLFEELTDPKHFKKQSQDIRVFQEEDRWQTIKQALPRPVTPVRKMNFRKIAVAASILLILGIGWWWIDKKDKTPEVVVKTDVEAPSTTKAIITLPDGRKIPLDQLTSLDQSGVQLTKTAEGKLIYSGNVSETIYNTLSNPRGSKVIDMQLSDGSHVWLNAGSSVTYPIAFVKNNREVQITGEAYFEVAPDQSKPFIVSRGTTSVTVLGTHFNVNAYEDEKDMKVTLLEGSVRVSAEQKTITIKPNEQAVIEANGNITVNKNVDVAAVMAWKNGRFQFSGLSVKQIMRQIGRWYDVEIIYTEEIPDPGFMGDPSRQENISEALRVLENTEKIHFRVEGRKVFVSK